jgi:hypothetical protein
MTLTTDEVWSVDGVVLNTLAFNIKTFEGRLNVPARKGSDLDAIADHGVIPVEDRPFEINRLVLGMWILGCDEDGLVPSDSNFRLEFEKNRFKLVRLFSRGRLMPISRTNPDGSVWTTNGKVSDGIDFSTMAGGTRAEFNVIIDVPGVFWEDGSSGATLSTPAGSSLPKTLSLDNLALATAPTTDSIIKVTGPITNPKVTEPLSGYSVELTGTVPTSQIWEVDSGLWTSKLNSTNNLGDITHTGGSRFMSIEPRPAGAAPTIVLTGSAASSTTKLECTAERKHL